MLSPGTASGSWRHASGSVKVKVKVPKLRSLSFETAIFERHRRLQASVEESLVEMYLTMIKTYEKI
jgi:transposase-like protein